VGQKVNPIGLRLGINKTWKSRWYVDPKEYADTLHEDIRLRKMIENASETQGGEIAEVEIVRHPQRVTLIVHTGRPGVIIGAKGANIEKLGKRLQRLVNKKIQLKIKEINRPETNAQLVAQNVARQIEGRGSFRRVMKKAVADSMKAGVQGVKIKLSGRLGGAEIARREEYKEGRIPLHTFRADIDYGRATAITTFGTVGVKVWIYRGDIFGHERKEDAGLLLKKQKGRPGADRDRYPERERYSERERAPARS
jgi:small subunit ribosomal protein S3